MKKKILSIMGFVLVFILIFLILNVYALEDSDKESALEALMSAEKDINYLRTLGLSVYKCEDILLQAKRAFFGHDKKSLMREIYKEKTEFKRLYLESLLRTAEETPPYEVEQQNYSEVLRLSKIISYRREQATKILDSLDLLKERIEKYKSEGIDVSQALDVMVKVEQSFNSERYEDAETLLQELETNLDETNIDYLRIKGLAKLSKNFFERNWITLIVIFLVLLISFPFVLKKIRIFKAKKKLYLLRLELGTLGKLVRDLQKSYFQEGNISRSTYNIRIKKYRKRIAEINHTIPVLQSIVHGKKSKSKKSIFLVFIL